MYNASTGVRPDWQPAAIGEALILMRGGTPASRKPWKIRHQLYGGERRDLLRKQEPTG